MSVLDEVMGVTEAKTRLSEIVRRFQAGTADHVFLVRNNKLVAVVVSIGIYDALNRMLAQVPAGAAGEDRPQAAPAESSTTEGAA